MSKTPQPRKITLSEVKGHSSSGDLWIVIHNDVLDLTAFLKQHPGGKENLLKYGGLDASEAFEKVGHSHEAREIAEQYKIGWLPPPERTRFVESVSSISGKSISKVSQKSSCESKQKVKLKPSPRNFVSKNSRDAKPHNLYGRKEPPCSGGGSKKKLLLLALAVAIIAAIAYKKSKQ